ncbi:MAG: hypothetical protein LBG92_00165, partial [Prevotellaceae bacterium]|nr:hypothetical protein [Prevotellaceae bacterium]
MRTKREDMKLSKELETIKNLKDEIKSLKTVLAQKKMEVEALDCLIEIIGVHYKANVKNKFRAKAITKLR